MAISAGLIPIVCVGELLAEREAGQTLAVIHASSTFPGGPLPEQAKTIVIAYEPVLGDWTGKVATPQQAEDVHLALRKIMANRYNEVLQIRFNSVRGSVKPDNAAELLKQPNIDGALVGGASLKADQFLGIVAGPCKRGWMLMAFFVDVSVVLTPVSDRLV